MCPFWSILSHSIPERLWDSKSCGRGFGVVVVRSQPRIKRMYLLLVILSSILSARAWQKGYFAKHLAHQFLENAVIGDQSAGILTVSSPGWPQVVEFDWKTSCYLEQVLLATIHSSCRIKVLLPYADSQLMLRR